MANNVIITNNGASVEVSVQNNTRVVQVNTLGPRGPVGPTGPAGPTGSIDTGSFVSTSSFNSFTGSYVSFSSSVSQDIVNLEATASVAALRNISNVFTQQQSFQSGFIGSGSSHISGSLRISEGWRGVSPLHTSSHEGILGLVMPFTCQSNLTTVGSAFAYGLGSSSPAAFIGAVMPYDGDIIAITLGIQRMNGGSYSVSPYIDGSIVSNGTISGSNIDPNASIKVTKLLTDNEIISFNQGDSILYKWEIVPTSYMHAIVTYFVRFRL